MGDSLCVFGKFSLGSVWIAILCDICCMIFWITYLVYVVILTESILFPLLAYVTA
jgi:hypothetical protein